MTTTSGTTPLPQATGPTVLTGTPVVPGVALGPVIRPSGAVRLPDPGQPEIGEADRPAEKVAEFGKKSDMGRPAQPEEISPAFVFLASPITGSYVNGAILPVMGGPRG